MCARYTMNEIFSSSLGWNENPAKDNQRLDPCIVVANFGIKVIAVKPKDPKKRNGLNLRKNSRGKIEKMNKPTRPKNNPKICFFTK